MKKVFKSNFLLAILTLMLTDAMAEGNETAVKTYELDATTIDKVKLQDNAKSDSVADFEKTTKPRIITEEIPNGRIEKLLDEENHIIAEKKVEGDKVTEKVLNYYYPTGQLMRKITSIKDSNGFQSKEYYQNGQIETEATYLNENNKIGTEKKYDIEGKLRQEIPWVLLTDEATNEKQQISIRQGQIITYYPDGKKAAVFSVGQKGENIFYNQQGEVIKEIADSEILKFSRELTDEDCQGKTIHLDMQSLIELYEDEGDISYNRCGMPYRENFVYEIFDNTPQKERMVSYDETGMIRRITPYVNGAKHGVEQKFDANGNLTAEINYQNGKKQGKAKGFFPTGETAFEKYYENGKVEGKLNCFFPTGEVAAEFNYMNGLKEGEAIINSPIKKQLQFVQNKLQENQNNKENRQMASIIPELNKPMGKCLQIEDRLSEIEQTIKDKAMRIEQIFTIRIPKGCEDINSFAIEENMLVCKDNLGQKKADVSLDYNNGKSVVENIYAPSGKIQYEIPITDKKKQGWVKTYDEQGHIISEMYFNQDKRAGNSRSYYPNGQVKEMITYADDAPRKVWVNYNLDGNILFSLTANENEKSEAYYNNPTTGKDVSIQYYKNKPDIIRESIVQLPYDFTEYNMALGEYAIYRNNELVSGGHICNIKPAENIIITNLKKTQSGQDSSKTPVLTADEAPLIDEKEVQSIEPVSNKEFNVKNAIIPSEKEKQQAELAAKNIGPVAKPSIENMAAVQKEVHSTVLRRPEENMEPKTEKFYYPNGNLRKTVKTKGSRTEEVKEYSKSGLLLTDMQYNKDRIIIEKYSGSGDIRRKTEKSYDDNAVNAFIKREDFYDNGNPRYLVERQPQTMLFSEKTYNAEGKIKTETIQTGPLTFKIKDFDKEEKVIKEESYPDNREIIIGKDNQIIRTYNAAGKVEIEVIWHNNGEISVKEYNKNGGLVKYAYLAASDGKLHIEKPELRTIPAYRERYWVDYNNPHWIENQDKYSIKSIVWLNLDIVSHIFTELHISVPAKIKALKEKY